MSLIHRTTVSSTTMAVIAAPLTPLRKTSTVTTMATTAPMSQPTPVVRRSWGSGGGAPDGRRLGARPRRLGRRHDPAMLVGEEFQHRTGIADADRTGITTVWTDDRGEHRGAVAVATSATCPKRISSNRPDLSVNERCEHEKGTAQ